MELKEDSPEKLAAITGKPTKHYLFAHEINALANKLKEWSPTTFNERSVVFYKNDIYILNNEGVDYPFNSSNIEDEITLDKWVKIVGDLEKTIIDTYQGTRLKPQDATLNGFHVEKNANEAIGFSANNPNTGNGAIAQFVARGTATAYSNAIAMQYFNSGYYLPSLQNTGAIFSTNKLNFIAINNNPVSIVTGTDLVSATEKVTFLSNGNVGIGKTVPTQKLDIVGKIAINDGGNSVFIGDGSGVLDNGTDNRNVGLGYQTLNRMISGSNNVGIGFSALKFSTGNENVALGSSALLNNSTGNNNAALGTYAMVYNSTGSNNVANGYLSLYANTTGNENIASGVSALFSNTVGFENIAVGTNAGRYDSSLTPTIASNRSIFIGKNTKPLTDNQTNQIVIGHDATGIGSNTVVLGNNSIITTALKGNVGIGTTTPSFTLDIQSTSSNIRIISSVGTNRAYSQFSNNGGTFNIGLDNSTGIGLGTNSPYAGTIMHYGNYPIVIGTNAQERVRIMENGNLGIGTTNAQAKLDVVSTTSGFLPPRMSNSQMALISPPIDGMIIYNTSYNNIFIYRGPTLGWKQIQTF